MRKDEIKTAAMKLFAVKGYAQTSMQEIADELNINKATIYLYFNSKKDLAVAILSDILTEFNEGLKGRISHIIDEPIDILFFEIYKYVMSFYENEYRLLFYKKFLLMISSDYDEDLRIESRRLLNDKDNNLFEIIGGILEAKKIDLNIEDTKKFLTSYVIFVHGYLDWKLYNTDLEKEFIEASMESNWLIFWNGSKSFFEFL